MSEKEFKVHNLSDVIPDGTQLAQANMFYCGNWVYVKKIDKKGLVKEVHIGEYEQLVTLLMEDGTILKVRSDECDFTTPDPKTAFLQDLSELLRKYDAKIDAGCLGWDSDNPFFSVSLGENTIEWTQGGFYNKGFEFPLTADNVLNYDK